MNRTRLNAIVNAVLYEGYVLYPYRPSVKNRQRWNFGAFCPQDYCRIHQDESWSSQTECLVRGSARTVLDVAVRFLHLTSRQVGRLTPPLSEWPAGDDLAYETVESLAVGGRVFQSWQEAEEREVEMADLALADLLSAPRTQYFAVDGRRWSEPLRQADGQIVGVLAREQQPLQGLIQVNAVSLGDGLFRLTVRAENATQLPDAAARKRDEALLRGFVSLHTMLGVHDGEFVSLLDPPPTCQQAAAACRNVCTWPVLAGEPGQCDTMLSSPIILYDYPHVAPESPGDLFDCTEIDEILSLRILTLTDEEKRLAADVDPRVRQLLARTEALAREQLLDLHGACRGLQTNLGGPQHD